MLFSNKNPPCGGSDSAPFHDGGLAVKCSPSFDAAPVSGFPVRQLRVHGEAGVKIKAESGFILKQDRDCFDAVIEFDRFNDLAFDLWEAVVLACASFAGTGSLVGQPWVAFLTQR
jgi:hypothetical protein